MKTKTILFLLLCVTVYAFEANGQTVVKIEESHLKELTGNWSGELTYLDYKDDKSKISLKVRTTNSWSKPALTRRTIFTEPNGKEIKSDSVLKIGDDRRSLDEDKDNWRVVKNDYDRDKKQRIIILETDGEDNNKKANLRKTIAIGKNQYSITKEVRYEGTSDYIFRNEFRFSRSE